MVDNPSIVKDSSGNNYGGILDQTNLASAANMAYLENLWELAQKAGPNAGNPSVYNPSGNEGIKVGGISNQTLGSIDLMAAGRPAIPFAMLDQMNAEKQKAEADYYAKVKTYLDKPIADLEAKLKNPFAQADFSSKIQGTVDAYLDTYAERFGGDYMKAYAAAVNDPNLSRTLSMYQNYADAYNMIFDDVTSIIKNSTEPDKYYVPPEILSKATNFLKNHGDMKDLSIDELAKNADVFRANLSIYKLVEAATSGFKDSTYESFPYKDTNMSNEEEDAYITKTVTGQQGQAQQIINDIVEANPWIKNDSSQMSLLSTIVENKLKHDVKYTISKVKKENATRNNDLRKSGIAVDEEGNVQFTEKPAALINATGTNSITYPGVDKPIPTVVGTYAYFVHEGKLRYGKLPQSYNFTPNSEYDLADNDYGIQRGRYVDGKMNFQSQDVFTPEQIRTASSKGQITDAMSIGDGRAMTQVQPTKIYDMLSQSEIEVFGETTVILPFDQIKGQIAGAIPHMGYVHENLEKQTFPQGNRRTFGQDSTKGLGSKDNPISLSVTDGLDKVSKSSTMYYKFGDMVLSGAEIHEKLQQ